MRDIDKEQPAIKLYLLGELSEEGRQRFEERFVTDPEFREIALIVEGELLDDYLAGLLSPREQEYLDSYYLSEPGKTQDLEFAKALREYATQGEPAGQAVAAAAPPPTGVRHRIINLLSGRRWLPASAVAALLFIALVISWNFVSSWFRGDPRAALNAEITLLNRQPRDGEVPFTVPLMYVLSRAAQESQKVSIPGGINIVELRLNIPRQQYQSYQVTLRVNDGPEVFTVGGLQVEYTKEGRVLKLRIPARLLTPQDYILSVNGLDAGGQLEDVAEYFFRVAG